MLILASTSNEAIIHAVGPVLPRLMAELEQSMDQLFSFNFLDFPSATDLNVTMTHNTSLTERYAVQISVVVSAKQAAEITVIVTLGLLMIR